MKKTRQTVEVPLKRYTGQFWKRGRAAKHGPYVFYNPATGDRFHDVKLGLKSAVKRAGLSGITWHTFRHTFTSRLTRNGADLVNVKELLGDSTVTVSMRYAHSNDEAKRRALGRLPTSDKSNRAEGPEKGRQTRRDSACNLWKSSKIGSGGMAERSKAAVLKTVSGVTHSGVRIPLPPPCICVLIPLTLLPRFSLVPKMCPLHWSVVFPKVGRSGSGQAGLLRMTHTIGNGNNPFGPPRSHRPPIRSRSLAGCTAACRSAPARLRPWLLRE